MKKTISISLVVLMLFAFGSALYQAEAQTPTPTPGCPECTPSCYWDLDNHVCYMTGTFCLDADNVDDAVFWYKFVGGSEDWQPITLVKTVVCAEGCVSYAITPDVQIDCGCWAFKVTFGHDKDTNIQCSGRFCCPYL